MPLEPDDSSASPIVPGCAWWQCGHGAASERPWPPRGVGWGSRCVAFALCAAASTGHRGEPSPRPRPLDQVRLPIYDLAQGSLISCAGYLK